MGHLALADWLIVAVYLGAASFDPLPRVVYTPVLRPGPTQPEKYDP